MKESERIQTLPQPTKSWNLYFYFLNMSRNVTWRDAAFRPIEVSNNYSMVIKWHKIKTTLYKNLKNGRSIKGICLTFRKLNKINIL